MNFRILSLLCLLSACAEGTPPAGSVTPSPPPTDPDSGHKIPSPIWIWLDFDGGDLEYVESCAGLGEYQTCTRGADGEYPEFDMTADFFEEVASEVEHGLDGWHTTVRLRPPAVGGFIHVVFAPMPGIAEPSRIGFATIDCGNKHDIDTIFVLAKFDAGVKKLGSTTVHEIGHSWGFDHMVDVKGQVMYPIIQTRTTFLDACIDIQILDGGDDNCPRTPEMDRHCADGQRNYHQELGYMIGFDFQID